MVYQRKWYAVTIGTEPGVYASWLEAGPKTRNIPGGAIHQSFLSEEEARCMFKAAKERGEVKAYPNAGKKDKYTDKPRNAPLSPLGEEVALLTTPLDLDVESTGLQTPPSSPTIHSRLTQLRRTLRDSTDSYPTSSSPPTNVTQVYAPLYDDDDDDASCNIRVARPSPHFTFASGSSRAYPSVSDGHLLGSGAEKVPFQLNLSGWGSSLPAASFADSYPSAEEHTSRSLRCMPRHRESSKSKGVAYRSLTDLADTESIDSRIWLPESRIFDPDKVKRRPATRPSSPVKKAASPAPIRNIIKHQVSSADTPFISVGRGRHSRLTPSLSLPILPRQEREDSCSDSGSRLTQLLESSRADNANSRVMNRSVRATCSIEQPAGNGPSTRNYGGSHVQLVPRDGSDEQSTIMVYCPLDCPHESCYRSLLAPSISTTRLPKSARPQYVDACISPISTITNRMQDTDSSPKGCSTGRSPVDSGSHPCELAGFTHVLQKGLAPDADVRSPIVKGMMVPLNATE